MAVPRLLLKPQVAQSEAMVGVVTQGVVKPGMLEHGADLGMALTKWLDHLRYLEERQEAPSDHQCMEGLKRMTAKLGLESELQVEARVVKRTGGVWDAKGMLEYLQSKVPEYPEESRSAKPKATAKVAKVEGSRRGGEGSWKQERSQQLCYDWYRGTCKRGEQCRLFEVTPLDVADALASNSRDARAIGRQAAF